MRSTAEPGSVWRSTLFLPATTEEDSARRDAPDARFVESVRGAFPTERVYDEMLTRKLERRGGPRPEPYRLDQLESCLRLFLDDHVVGDHAVSEVRWLSGGASKIQVGFTLDWTPAPGAERTRTRMVLRMEPRESLNATSRQREFELIRAMQGVVPVPQTYWLDEDGSWFPEAAIIYAFAEGVTKPAAVAGRVSGTGNPFTEPLRGALGAQFVRALAKIHTTDWRAYELPSFDAPAEGTTESVTWQLNRALRVWEEDRGEDWPIVEVVANWLADNLPVTDRVSVVHGDFRAGNFLFDEERRRVTAWLDWERGHLGDRHRDLAWTTLRVFGNHAGEDHEFLVSGLLPEAQFFEEYERLTGLVVDRRRLHFYRVFTAFQLVISNLASAHRVIRLGRSHQDILLAWIEGVVYPFAHQMITTIERGPDV